MGMNKDLEDLEAFFRRLESDPASIDAETLVGAFRAIRKWMLVSTIRLQVLEERIAELEAARRQVEARLAQLEAAMEVLQRRYEESQELLRQIVVHRLWWDLAREAFRVFSTN